MQGQSAVQFPGQRRIHIALAVQDLQRSQTFYETLLGVAPAKQRPGYVKFEPQDPSVNLTLNEVSNAGTSGNPTTHFGVQVKSTQAVQNAVSRLSSAGLKTRVEEHTTCCYAVQDKVWVSDPDGNQWEVFVVLEADAKERMGAESTCCATDATRTSADACC